MFGRLSFRTKWRICIHQCRCIQILRRYAFLNGNMLRTIMCCVFVSLYSFSVYSQENFRIVFWNTENLFDCKDDPRKNDNEFLPDATRHWDNFRYWSKLKNLAKGIVASGKEYVPDLVGLCEVENDSCLYDLTRRSLLKEADYKYVMTDSPDRRGIDVALLYQRGKFKLLQHESVRIPHEKWKKGPTRDILHVTGKVISGDTLDVFVCHLPSRSSGKAKSEPYRLLVGQVLKHAVDSVMKVRKHPYVVVMGDFNDGPRDKSMKELCSDGLLYNMMKDKKGGTYRYRGEWGILDQFLVSKSLLQEKGNIATAPRHAQILQHEFLLEDDEKYGGKKPYRTYNGMRYSGGFSDHLPISLDLEITIRDDKDCYLE